MVHIEKECMPRCRSHNHISELIVAVSKANFRQAKLFLATCHNAFTSSDQLGRTVLHVAASCGHYQLLEWLVTEMGMDVNVRDLESGWTALHRAFFYGQISTARLLISLGASLEVRDKEGLTALEIIMKDRLPHVQISSTGLQEAYTWGDNANFNLGHETELHRKNPEIVDCFRKRKLCVKQVCMNKYHSIFVTSSGLVFTCGHGRGGRLGLDTQNTVLEPTLVESLRHDVCVYAVAAKDHSMFLMQSGSLYSCGMNDYHQLGQLPPPQACLVPRLVNGKQLKGKTIKGVRSNRFHSVIYTENAVFTFGFNAGQLGHLRVSGETLISQPRQVSSVYSDGASVKLVTCSQAATAVYTSRGQLFLLHEYQTRKLLSKKQLDIVQIEVQGGNLDHSLNRQILKERGGTELIVALLNQSGQAFIWRGEDSCLRRCVWSISRPLHVQQFVLNAGGLAFITVEGDAFTATYSSVKPRRSGEARPSKSDKDPFDCAVTLSELVAKDDTQEVKVERVVFVHRATAVAVDPAGCNFAVLQAQPIACLTEIPMVDPSRMRQDMKVFLQETSLNDSIHDCVLKISSHLLPAHQFVLASRSSYFARYFAPGDRESEHPVDGDTTNVGFCVHPVDSETASTINLGNINIELFTQLLEYCYTDSCDFLVVGSTFHVDNPEETKKNDELESHQSSNKGPGGQHDTKGKKKSAYEVHKKKKSESHNESKEEEKSAKDLLGRFREMAKFFGMKELIKKLECVAMTKGGVIELAKERHQPYPHIHFRRDAVPQLYDVTLACSDGKLLQAHKCVLVARLEYFNSMFASGWIEATTEHPLTFPVPSDLLAAVLEYLYSDESEAVSRSEDAEWLMNLMVVADQLLMGRLRQLCETACTALVNLKNACELLELSTFYNAGQLHVTCQQFICINMAALIETGSLNVLSQQVLDDLSVYYRSVVPGMSNRVLGPYSGYPSREELERLQEEAKSSGRMRKDSYNREERGKAGRSKRHAPRKNSGSETQHHGNTVAPATDSVVSPRNSLSESAEFAGGTTTPESPCSPVVDLAKPAWTGIATPSKPAAGKITTVPEQLPSPSTVWSGSAPRAAMWSGSAPRAAMWSGAAPSDAPKQPGSAPTLRHIMQQEQEARAHTGASVNVKVVRGGKLSQKERKRLAQEAREAKDAGSNPRKSADSDPANPLISPPIRNPWGVTPTAGASGDSVTSLVNVIKAEASVSSPTGSKNKVQQQASVGGGEPVQRAPPSFNGAKVDKPLAGTSGSRGSGWAWQPSTQPQTRLPSTPSFSEILNDQEAQNQALKTVSNKPLHLIQIEERAIQELMAHYRVMLGPDARLTVHRVPASMATPTWAALNTPRV